MTESIEQLTSLEKFHVEVSELKRKEEEEGKTVHFQSLSPEKLTELDAAIYNKFKDGTLTFKEFSKYRNLVSEEKDNESSRHFVAYLANQGLYWLDKMSR